MLFYQTEKPPFFSKKNEIPGKNAKAFGFRGSEVSMEGREQNVCRVNGTCFRAASVFSFPLLPLPTKDIKARSKLVNV